MLEPEIVTVSNQIRETIARRQQLQNLVDQDDWRTKDVHRESLAQLDVMLEALRRHFDTLIHRTDEL